MKKVILLVGLWLPGAACVAQRLPHVAEPESYILRFTPDFEKNNFAGEETIQIRVLEPVNAITLNATGIEFEEVILSTGSRAEKAEVKLDPSAQTATLATRHPIPAGPATLHLRYRGILNDDLRGFYLGKDEQGRKYAATQLEDTDARRAFPSFDEPAYKATFDVTVVADKDMTVISNGKVISDEPGPGTGKHTVHFAMSPKMSSYLVALVVGHFEYVEGSADGVPIRVYASPGKKDLSTFALEAAEHNLKFYDQYFGIKYPYGKLDLVGLADFSAGAMENTGCITFRELLLLVDEKRAAISVKKIVASVIAHEMAHQWFGDLVTMQWWDDKWLNEGFATWMASKPVAAWKPGWNARLSEVSDAINSLNQDALVNTHPIHQLADTPAQILELDDAITYGKTAAVLRMLESYLGPETFRAGVNAYLRQHAYGNATAADFWTAQTQVSKQPVDKIMPTWVEQAGAPMLSVKEQCSGNEETITVEQQRYFYDRAKFDADTKELWQIPICVKEDSSAARASGGCALVPKKQAALKLQGCAPWRYINANAIGFYRSAYDSETVHALAKDAETALTPGERMMLLEDVWAGVRVNREPIGDYLALIEALRGDRNDALFNQLELPTIADELINDANRAPFQAWVRQTLGPAAKEVGWEPKLGESEGQSALRGQLLWLLGYVGQDPETLRIARNIADRALADPASVDQELALLALQVAATNGDEVFYNRILADLKASKTPENYFHDVLALCRFNDPKLVERTLEFAISPEMRSQDSVTVIGQVMQNPAAQPIAWTFVQTHWATIEKLGGAFAGGYIVQSTGNYCDAKTREEVKAFFTAHPAPAADRSLKQSEERVNYCIDLKAQQQHQLTSWLQQWSASSKN